MSESWTELSRFIPLISIVLLAFTVSSCDDGKDGAAGIGGTDGADKRRL